MSSRADSKLRQLVNIISSSVDAIEKAGEEAGIKYPSLDDVFQPAAASEAFARQPDIVQASSLAVSACFQLMTTLNVPALTLLSTALGFHISSALRAAAEGNIVEILRDHPNGLHVDGIAKENGMEADKIARVLRLLATHHIFIEVTPNVFKNNRLSAMMDTLKPIVEIKAQPGNRHAGTSGISAIIGHSTDEVFKSSAYMTEALSSGSTSNLPFREAFKTEKNYWEWLEEPSNAKRLERFSIAMRGGANSDPPDAILKGFQWSSLPEKSLVVDVGGGMGHLTMKIYEKNSGLRYIVQDRKQTIDKAKEHWAVQKPSAIDSGVVRLEVHDFFSPQPVKDAAIFFLSAILHDHDKTDAAKILKMLRGSASPNTKLLIKDQILTYACVDPEQTTIKGYSSPQVPQPLLANLGKAGSASYLSDLQMLVALGGEERTLGAFKELLSHTGWKLVEVFPVPGSLHRQLLAVPI